MDTGCSALVGELEDMKLALKNPSRDDDSNSDSDDNCNGAELLAAAEEGRGADAVLSILQKNPSFIRTGDFVGNTVLHMAARDGDIVTICKLTGFLEERQDEDLKKVFVDVNVDGDTALHLALKNRHRKVAFHLIQADEWVEYIRNNDGIDADELAVEAGFIEVCELEADESPPTYDALVDVHAQWIELEKAINKGEEDVLIAGLMRDGKELLWHQEKWGDTLLHVAVTARRMRLFRKLVQFMINNGLTDAALLGDRNGNTALHRATKNVEFNKAIYLIKAEPRAVYQVNHCGESPLYLAVKLRHEDLVERMVTQSCLPRDSEMLRHPKHATLAHLAIKARSFGTLKLLLKHKPELVKGKDEKGWRPLSYAANKGYLDEVTYILTNFPESAEKRDKDGSFPIHKAVGGDHVSIVKAFYELYPQSLHHVDRKGRNVLQIAVSFDRVDLFTYLTKELKLNNVELTLKNPRDDDNNSDSDDGCDGAELLAAAKEGRGADVVVSILTKNPSLTRTGDPVGNTVLHMTARDGNIVTVCHLIAFLEERQDKDLKEVFRDVNVDGDTALHLALKNRHREVAYHLIKAEKGMIHKCNNDGISPYELAKEAGFNEVCECRDLKPFELAAHVDVEMTAVKRDLMGESRGVPVRWNELHWAIKKGDEDVLITRLRDGKELLWHQDNWGQTLLHVAVTARRMGLFRKHVQFMISNGLTDAALLGDKNGSTALHRATVDEEFSKAICLIKAEPRAVYQVNHCGESPLYLAVKLRHEDLVEHMVTQSCLPPWESEMLRHPKHATLAHLAIKSRLFGTPGESMDRISDPN